MKTALALLLASLAITPAFAQVLRPGAVNGAVLGGVAGAIIGNNSGDLRHNAWRGAAYGAGAGLILGSIADNAHERRVATQVTVPTSPRVYVRRHVPSYYRYGYGYYGGYPEYYGSVYYSSPESYTYADDEYSDGTDYRGNGLLLGALAGAIIGNNSGGLRHNAWRGAAYGAATGYLLGALAENHVRSRAAAVVNSTPSAYASPTEPGPAPTQEAVTARPTTPSPAAPTSNMAAANSLFGRK